MVSIFLHEWDNSLSNTTQLEAAHPADFKYYQTVLFSVYAGVSYRFNKGLTVGARGILGLSSEYLDSQSAMSAGTQVFPYAAQILVSRTIFKF